MLSLTNILPDVVIFCLVFSSQTNGVLYVGKEERATTVVPQGHEVLISVVENTRKLSTGSGEEMKSETFVLSKKRPKSMLNDIVTAADTGDSTLLVNGPFVASEMLRNVAKRQRRHSDGASLVNGVADQKGPMAWDELVRAQAKPSVTSPKLPIAVNGVRLDISSEHAPKTDLDKIQPNKTNKHVANTAIVGNHSNATNTCPSNYSSMTNTTIGNHSDKMNAIAGNHCGTTNTSDPRNRTSTVPGNYGNMMETTTNQTGSESRGIPSENILPRSLHPVATQAQSSCGNTVTQSDTSTAGVSTPRNENASDNLRGDQTACTVLPYICLWSGCNWYVLIVSLLYYMLP